MHTFSKIQMFRFRSIKKTSLITAINYSFIIKEENINAHIHPLALPLHILTLCTVTHLQSCCVVLEITFTIANVTHDAQRISFESFYELLQNSHPMPCYTRCKSQSLQSSPCTVYLRGLSKAKG